MCAGDRDDVVVRRGAVAALKDGVVEGVKDLPAGAHFEHAAPLRRGRPLQQGDRFGDLFPLELRQKAEVARVDAEHADAQPSCRDGGLQNGAVAAEDDEHVRPADRIHRFKHGVGDALLLQEGEEGVADGLIFFCLTITIDADVHANIIQYFIHLCNQNANIRF